jgi:hypothetical protein
VVIAERPPLHLAIRSPAGVEPGLAIAERTTGLLEALERSSDLADVVDLHQQASALSGLARADRLGLAEQNRVAAARVRIQHRAGTLLRQLASEHRPSRAKRARGRGPLRPQLPPGVLKWHGISGQESSVWQSIASLSLVEIERRMDELCANSQEISAAEFYRRGRTSLRRDRNSRNGASPAELRLRGALASLKRIRVLTSPSERQLAEAIAGCLRSWGLQQASTRPDLTVVVSVCLLCGRPRHSLLDHHCGVCGGAWATTLG